MTKRPRIFYLFLFITALAVLNRWVTGSWSIPSGDASIWLHSGLLMLIIGSYWIEPFFTRPADVVINGLVVVVSVLTLDSPPHSYLWNTLAGLAAILVLLSLILIWKPQPVLGVSPQKGWARVVYHLATRVGSAKVLFSAVFLLGLISYSTLGSPDTQLFAAFWGGVLIFSELELPRLVDHFLQWSSHEDEVVLGRVARLVEPRMVRFQMVSNVSCPKGSWVGLTSDGRFKPSSPIAYVLGHRRSPEQTEAEALIVDGEFAGGELIQESIVVKLDERNATLQERLGDREFLRRADRLTGFADEGTDIGNLRFELVRRPDIEEGHLVSVPVTSEMDLLFQVIDGRLRDEPSIEGSERHFTVGQAGQLGTWDDEKQGFRTFSWVVPENAPVFHVTAEGNLNPRLREGLLNIGRVPNSAYPANINLKNLVLFHTAILGVTGSGKSFLAYHLIESCIREGIKVLCLDVTGDYKRYLNDPVLLKTHGAVTEYLESDRRDIGIVEFNQEAVHPIEATRNISQMALRWAKENRTPDEIRDPVPKLLIVLEEAHTLVPEWNANPNRNLQDVVNRTAQITLQARKYGLGFMVVTQRTANVTKSILNQCNSIFAFQAYDETGFEFMKNYMGESYVRALPNLRQRQGIIVGKASVSDRPVIARFHDQDREALVRDVPEIPEDDEDE